MEFKTWLEASVSSEGLSNALEKTLMFVVDGKWSFQDRGSVVVNSGKRRIQIRKTADLIRNGSSFRLSLDAGFSENAEAVGLGPFSHKQYETSEGLEDLEIKCMLWKDGNLIGKRGFSGDPLGRTLPFNNPMDLAKWVKDMTEERPDEDEGDDEGDLDPVPPNNSKFLHV